MCLILPPKQVHHTVLLFRSINKLLFCLCRTCAIDLNNLTECTNETVAERAVTGTWVMDEVRLPVEKGYEIIDIYNVYEYQHTQYEPQTGQGRLFFDYIDTFLKLKAEASGYSSWVRTPEDEDRYIQNFCMTEGIRLDRDGIRPNAAKRGLAKLCLNSMWGKLTELTNRTKSKMITDPEELYIFLATPGIEVMKLMFASDDVVWASWRFSAEERVPSLRHTNEVIGAYVTAGGRTHHYTYLDRLQDTALYCDIDSVVYIQPRDETDLVETGESGSHDK